MSFYSQVTNICEIKSALQTTLPNDGERIHSNNNNEQQIATRTKKYYKF